MYKSLGRSKVLLVFFKFSVIFGIDEEGRKCEDDEHHASDEVNWNVQQTFSAKDEKFNKWCLFCS